MHHIRRVLLGLGLVGLAMFTWMWLSRRPAVATWLTATAPHAATIGESLPVQITTNASTPEGWVSVDLHWSTPWHATRGFLSEAPAQRVVPEGSTLSFVLPVPVRKDLGYVRAVVYVSPTRRWADSVRTAMSEAVGTVPAAPEPHPATLTSRRLKIYDESPDPAADRRDSSLLSALIALLWVGCAVICWRRRQVQSPPPPNGLITARQWWQALALACGAAAIWESLPMERTLGDIARTIAVNQRWYGARMGFQLGLTSLMVAGLAGSVVIIWRRNRDRARRGTLLGLGCYAALALISLLSLHKVDAMLAMLIFTIPVLQLLQLATVVLAIAGHWKRTADGR